MLLFWNIAFGEIGDFALLNSNFLSSNIHMYDLVSLDLYLEFNNLDNFFEHNLFIICKFVVFAGSDNARDGDLPSGWFHYLLSYSIPLIFLWHVFVIQDFRFDLGFCSNFRSCELNLLICGKGFAYANLTVF